VKDKDLDLTGATPKEKMSFEILPPVETKDIHHGCLNCGHTHTLAPMDAHIAAGFGAASITKDSEYVFMSDMNSDEDPPTLQHFEDMAKADPDHDWRFSLYLPMREAEYQRQGPEQWVLVKSGMGFA